MKLSPHHFTRRKLLLFTGLLSAMIALPALGAVLSERYFFEAPYNNERSFHARLNVALGDVRIGKADRGYLFQGEVELENERLRPRFDFESRNGRATLHVDLDSDGRDGRRSIGLTSLSSARASQWIMLFGDRAPVELDLKMGLASGNLDFTGIPLKRLSVDCGASRTIIVFSRPNPVEMDHLAIKAGASTLTARNLGNSRAKNISIDGGAGRFYVDFSGGALPRGASASVNVGMASLTVIVPDDTPVALKMADSWLTRVEPPNDFVKKEGGMWHSANFRDQSRAFNLDVKAGVGTVRIFRASDAPGAD